MVEKILRQVIEGFLYGLVLLLLVGIGLLGIGAVAFVVLGCWYAAFTAEHIVVNVLGHLGLAFCACCLVYAVLWLRRQGIKAKMKGVVMSIYNWGRGED